MTSNYKTEQESFWAGEFGDEYTARNEGDHLVASNIYMFGKILKSMDSRPESIIEFGANRGLNIRALKRLFPATDFTALEINPTAVQALQNINRVEAIETSILDYQPGKQYDMTLIKGVLIHIAPDQLQDVYRKLYEATGKYLVIVEYYNPVPVAIPYRGHENKLFKRDFAGEMMNIYPDMKLIDYGFSYHRDTKFPQDDVNWFLLEKKK
jgi:pseudaminic acid biosynthesis-associated methylase